MSDQWIAIGVTATCALTVHVSIFLWWRRKWGVLKGFGGPKKPGLAGRAMVISNECETLAARQGDAGAGQAVQHAGSGAVASEAEMGRLAALRKADSGQ